MNQAAQSSPQSFLYMVATALLLELSRTDSLTRFGICVAGVLVCVWARLELKQLESRAQGGANT